MRKKTLYIPVVTPIATYLLSILLVFIFACVIAKWSAAFSSQSLKQSIQSVKTTPLFMEMLKSENHALFHNQKDTNDLSFAHIFFSLGTNVSFSDPASLLGREVPGLSLFESEIVVAGKGTTLATVPIESPLPDNSEWSKLIQAGDDKSEESDPVPAKGDPLVYIYHTHSWESYLPMLGKKSTDASSSDTSKNVIAVGDMMAKELNAKGIVTQHSKVNIANELHKNNMKWVQAYQMSRKVVQAAIAKDKTKPMLIDVHRDSSHRKLTTSTINKKSYARIAIVLGAENKNYEENKAFAKKIEAKIEKQYPGLSRGIISKTYSEGNGIYNQDLSSHAILVEIGGVDNTETELSRSATALADVISEEMKQAMPVNK